MTGQPFAAARRTNTFHSGVFPACGENIRGKNSTKEGFTPFQFLWLFTEKKKEGKNAIDFSAKKR
jgi:hypothetical protein